MFDQNLGDKVLHMGDNEYSERNTLFPAKPYTFQCVNIEKTPGIPSKTEQRECSFPVTVHNNMYYSFHYCTISHNKDASISISGQ